MTENDFWMFLTLSHKNGRIPMVSGYVDNDNPEIQKASEYIGGHSVLFEGHDRLPLNMVQDMGKLLFERNISIRAKQTILVILAHHPTKDALNLLRKYNENPNKELLYFARFALEECSMWNE